MADHFPPNSRYYQLATAELARGDEPPLVYLRRRFVPDPALFSELQQYRVVDGDRLDRLAAAVQGDSLQFWRLADGNGVLKPAELEERGRSLRLTLPLGMSGPGHA